MNNSNEKPFTATYRNYKDCYVNEHAGTTEYDSRGRRLRKFKVKSRLIEEVRRPSPEHDRILQIIKRETDGSLDHVSFWWLYIGEHVRKAVVMVEPYYGRLGEYTHPELSVRQVPPRMAPYGGGGNCTDDNGDRQSRTSSFLIMSKINEAKLLEIEAKLVKAASTMPEWDEV